MDLTITANASFGFDPDKRVEKKPDFEYCFTKSYNHEPDFERGKFSKVDCKSCGKFFTFGGDIWYRKDCVIQIMIDSEKKTIEIFSGSPGDSISMELVVINGSVSAALEHFVDVISN